MLSIQSSLELPLAMVVDNLHCIYLGVTKLLLSLWFEKEFRTKEFSIKRKVNVSIPDVHVYFISILPEQKLQAGQVDLAETYENGNENERGNENEKGKGRQTAHLRACA